jgi:hypothetical protein
MLATSSRRRCGAFHNCQLCDSAAAIVEPKGNAMPTNKLTDDIGKVIEAAEAGDIFAHRILMLASRCPQDVPPTIWDKATKAAAVDWLEHAVATSAHAESDLKTNSDHWIEENAPTKLRGDIDRQLQVIEAAEAGDHVAHNSLVKLYWSMVNAGETPPLFVTSYVGRANLRPAPRRPRGKHTPHQHLHRDQTLMALIVLACIRFGLQPTRNRAAKIAGHPCGASLVAPAVRRRGIKISEIRLANMLTENGGERFVAAIQKYIACVAKKPALPAA